MAKHSLSLFELAKKGATLRYEELKAEIASLSQIFPHLSFGSAVSPAMPDASEEPLVPRRRRRTPAAQRKTDSLKDRQYLAARRKVKR